MRVHDAQAPNRHNERVAGAWQESPLFALLITIPGTTVKSDKKMRDQRNAQWC